MTEREKIDAAVVYLKSLKVSPSSAAPPIFRLLWALGIYVPPPHFLSPGIHVLMFGPIFGVAMFVVVSICTLTPGGWAQGRNLEKLLAFLCLGAGVFFGVVMAAYYRWSAKKLNLPLWKEFSPDAADADDTW